MFAFGSLLPVVCFFFGGVTISFLLSAELVNAGMQKSLGGWFDADTYRVFITQNYRLNNLHYRTSVHPLSSILLSTPTIGLRVLIGSAELASRITSAAGAGMLAATFFIICRFLTRHTLDAILYTNLVVFSASFLFFASAFELYVWGALTILFALSSALAPRQCQPLALVAGSAASLSMTVTNWSAGLVVTALAVPWRQAILYSALALSVVAALTAIQSNIYPDSGKFLYLGEEPTYANIDISAKLLRIPREFFVDPIIVPNVASSGAAGTTSAKLVVVWAGGLRPVLRNMRCVVGGRFVLGSVRGLRDILSKTEWRSIGYSNSVFANYPIDFAHILWRAALYVFVAFCPITGVVGKFFFPHHRADKLPCCGFPSHCNYRVQQLIGI